MICWHGYELRSTFEITPACESLTLRFYKSLLLDNLHKALGTSESPLGSSPFTGIAELLGCYW